MLFISVLQAADINDSLSISFPHTHQVRTHTHTHGGENKLSKRKDNHLLSLALLLSTIWPSAVFHLKKTQHICVLILTASAFCFVFLFLILPLIQLPPLFYGSLLLNVIPCHLCVSVSLVIHCRCGSEIEQTVGLIGEIATNRFQLTRCEQLKAHMSAHTHTHSCFLPANP